MQMLGAPRIFIHEPRQKKTYSWDFRPAKTQIGLLATEAGYVYVEIEYIEEVPYYQDIELIF